MIAALLLLFAFQGAPDGADAGWAPPVIDDGEWVSYRPLTWDDFHQEKRGWRSEQAWIVSTVRFERLRVGYEQVGDQWLARPEALRVYAVMSKLESGYQLGGRDEYTLAHEQGHFDLTEVMARRLRAQARTLEVSGASREAAAAALETSMTELFDRGSREWQDLQTRYDGETGHGTRKKEQKRWWQRIAEWLAQPPP